MITNNIMMDGFLVLILSILSLYLIISFLKNYKKIIEYLKEKCLKKMLKLK